MVAAALIAAFACPAQPAVLVQRRPGVVRTTAVACDGDRRVVVRRARLARGAGTRIVDVSGAGRRVAWGELRYARGRVQAVIGAGRIERGRLRAVRTREASANRRTAPRLEVVAGRSGPVAWLVGDEVREARFLDGHAHVHAWDARGPLVGEDGRTARWWTRDGLLAFADLGRGPMRCSSRRRFATIAETPEVVVSAADYATRSPGETVRVIRACLRTDRFRLDPVIAQLRSAPGHALELAGIHGEYVVLGRTVGGDGGACESAAVEIYWARYGYPDRGAAPLPCGRGIGPGTPIAVTQGGAPAWIVDDGSRSLLLTAAGTGAITLDSAGPGGLTGLVADGAAIRWSHDGEPRSIELG